MIDPVSTSLAVANCSQNCHIQVLPANKLANVRRRAERAMGWRSLESIVTCPASRHVMMMADALASKRKYHMFDEEPEHCAGSIYSVLESLWKARAEIKRLTATKRNNEIPMAGA